ncbi:hypothetical protein I545_0118 [Mycobacterium kansasii 662]|uniref:Uncharacterized protein n=2 Tax=Mycobacterium kansasii TaxID=1768 RepID=U5X2D5_MYCKA|nr:hypothetical protein MKAN_20200 [Mycobacterium kansasii ATCC 12478]EUA22167.1 hypothetical protein I545_0118 [Mycobacterium kansasii 662]KEP43703.1 hypothetical protein MKSMC1_10670 [Mycobacterium kansasii]
MALATRVPSALFNCVVIRSVPGGGAVSGDVLGWAVFWLVHAPTGAMAAESTAAAQAAGLFNTFMACAYPD